MISGTTASAGAGGTYPAAMAAADEIAVERFMAGEAGFLDIPVIIESVLENHRSIADPDLETILAADEEARVAARRAPVGVTA